MPGDAELDGVTPPLGELVGEGVPLGEGVEVSLLLAAMGDGVGEEELTGRGNNFMEV